MSSGLRHGRTREGWQEKRQTRHLLTKADQEDAKFVTSRPDPTGNQATSTISGEQTVADRRENHGRPRTQETSSNNDGQNVANRRDPGRSGTTLFNQWRATRCGAGGSKSRGGGRGGDGIANEVMHIADEHACLHDGLRSLGKRHPRGAGAPAPDYSVIRKSRWTRLHRCHR